MVTRVAGLRGPGAKSLFAFGYADLADLLGEAPIKIAKYVHDGRLDPLNLRELVIASRMGLAEPKADETHAVMLAEARERRPTSITEVCSAVPPRLPPPRGLETLWAISYSDVAGLLGISTAAIHAAAGGGRIDMTSLPSVVAYIEARTKTK